MKNSLLSSLVLLILGLSALPLWSQPPSANASDSTVNTMVESMPEFPGGEEAMIAFLRKNIKYPNEARREKIGGVVYVVFVINSDGSIVDQSILKSPHQSLSDEALRVIGKMPAWKPGYQKGKAVRVKMNLPIRFTLPEDPADLDAEKDKPKAKQLRIHTERAEKAFDDKSYKDCLYHLMKLKELQKPSADLLAMEAFCLAELGDMKLACETFAEIPESQLSRSMLKKKRSICF